MWKESLTPWDIFSADTKVDLDDRDDGTHEFVAEYFHCPLIRPNMVTDFCPV